ncbi:MAG: hypothetical protein AAGA54_04905 [Myxococcota bacterium]
MRRTLIGCALLAGCADAPVTSAAGTGGGSTAADVGDGPASPPPATATATLASASTGRGADASTTTGTSSPTNTPPIIRAPTRVELAEEENWSLAFDVSDPDDDILRVFATGLPPGARWSEVERTLSFRPDFIQGAVESTWDVTIIARDGFAETTHTLSLSVDDTVQPPAPAVIGTAPGDGFTWQTIAQTTDDFLDSPGYAGRTYDAIVARPDDIPEGTRLPVLIVLHGFDGTPPMTGWSGEFRIMPSDPDNTYWWGYADSLPGSVDDATAVPPYTQRRVLHLLEWVLRNEPAADPERVVIQGSSMGGAGATTIGLLHARHFSAIDAAIGQAIPRNHRPSRVAQLRTLWGEPDAGLPYGGLPVWDAMDLTRALEDHPDASDLWLFTRHGKDDPIIHFGAAVFASPQTRRSWYGALQDSGVGHQVVWDEGSHGPADPLLGEGWWQAGWNPNFDDTAFTRRSLAVVGFSNASHDRDPGTGEGNGNQPWSDENGFAGELATPGDTGWNGDIAGALNRFLRWDANGIVDTIDRFEVPLRVLDGDGTAPPAPGYPSRGDRFDGELPVVVDVSLRRVQAFRTRPGESVSWSYAETTGRTSADAQGRLRIPALPLTHEWQTLIVTRG